MADLFTIALIFSTIRLSTPLILAALGGLFSERSGVINIALEGMMLAGAFTAAAVTHATGSPWAGLAAAVGAGVLIALMHAVASIRYQGGSSRRRHRHQHSDDRPAGLPERRVFPLVGLDAADPDRASRSPCAYRDGVRIRAGYVVRPVSHALWPAPSCGGRESRGGGRRGRERREDRYSGVLLSGALAALGGAYLSIGQSSLFTRNMTSGRGFIALAALIFGKWRPVQTLLACLFFGFTEAITIQMQGVVKLPSGDPTSSAVHSDGAVRADDDRAGWLHRPLPAAAGARPALREGTVSAPPYYDQVQSAAARVRSTVGDDSRRRDGARVRARRVCVEPRECLVDSLWGHPELAGCERRRPRRAAGHRRDCRASRRGALGPRPLLRGARPPNGDVRHAGARRARSEDAHPDQCRRGHQYRVRPGGFDGHR